MSDNDGSLKQRVARQGEEAFGRFAQDLLRNPLVHSTITAVFETRERAGRVQEVAMGALNLPSASDLERLTRRLRSVSQRIEGIEDGLDRIAHRLEQLSADPGSAAAPAGDADLSARLRAIEQALERIQQALAGAGDPSD